MGLRTAIVWIHAAAGAAWVAACVAFVIAGLAIAAGSDEQRNFTLRAVAKIDGFNLAAAIVVLVTGIMNLALAAMIRNFQFSMQFGLILAAKVILFTAMSLALVRTLRTVASLRNSADPGGDAVADATTRMVQAHGAIAMMGGLALLLGLWLMGS